MIDPSMRGTIFPTAYEVVLKNESIIGCRAVELWPNGWLTVYEPVNQESEDVYGWLLPPSVIAHVMFKERSADAGTP